jgi:hypothetical protein
MEVGSSLAGIDGFQCFGVRVGHLSTRQTSRFQPSDQGLPFHHLRPKEQLSFPIPGRRLGFFEVKRR